MALARVHTTAADGTFSATGATAWNAAHGVTGATSGGIPYFDSATSEASSALLAANGLVLGGGAGTAPFTDAGITYTPSTDVFQTNGKIRTSLAASNTVPSIGPSDNIGIGADTDGGLGLYLNSLKRGVITSSGIGLPDSAHSFFWANAQAAINSHNTNSICFSAGSQSSAGGGTSRVEINKNVTAIANNTATATLTVTIPNGAHSAGGKIILKGSAGAGGAIGADEFTALIEYDWIVTRTAGVNAVATLSTALLTAITASVAGGATPTIAAALSAISGAVGASNTFTFNVTINALTGSSTNHTCFVYATLLNDNASGVTIA